MWGHSFHLTLSSLLHFGSLAGEMNEWWEGLSSSFNSWSFPYPFSL